MTRVKEFQALLEELETPPATLEYTTQRCLARVKRKNRTRWFKVPAMAIVTFLIVFTALANTSVAFARSISEVPLLSDLAKFVTFDPSLKAAVDNKYVQPVNLSQTRNGITFSIPYVIADKQQLVVFYTLQSESTNLRRLQLDVDNLTDSKGNELSYSAGFGTYPDAGNGLRSVTFNFNGSDMPCSVVLKASFYKEVGDNTHITDSMAKTKDVKFASYSFEIHADRIKDAQVFTPKKKITVLGQQIIIEKVEVYPTLTKVTIGTGLKNTAFLKEIGLRLKDEQGRIWGDRSGLTATYDGSDNNVRQVYIESSYFSGARHLSLCIDSASCLIKNLQTVKVDLKKGIASPLTDSIRLVSLKKSGKQLYLSFSKKNFGDNVAGIFSGAYSDATGKRYSFTPKAECTVGSNLSTQSFYIDHYKGNFIYLDRNWAPNVPLKNPIEINLS